MAKAGLQAKAAPAFKAKANSSDRRSVMEPGRLATVPCEGAASTGEPRTWIRSDPVALAIRETTVKQSA